MKSAAEFQKEYRQRQAERRGRMEAALKQIIILVGDKSGPVAVEVRAVAERGLE